jgi:hypothetical protein
MTTRVGNVVLARFIHPMEEYALMKGEQMRRDLSHRYVERDIMQGGPGRESIFMDCRSFAEFEAKFREGLIFLASETGLHDVRTRSLPAERVHIHLVGKNREGQIDIPQEYANLARVAGKENRAFLLIDTNDRRVYCSGNTDKDPEKIFTAFIDSFGLSLADTGASRAPAVLVLPLVKPPHIVVGVAVVEGLRREFLLPHVDLAAIRKFGLHAADMFRLGWMPEISA